MIPVGGDGVEKYILAFHSPFGAIREVDGRRGRSVRGAAELTVPWDGGPMTVWVRAHGAGEARVKVDGKPFGHARLGGGWAEVAIAGPDVAAGEHRVSIDVPSGALVHDVELAAPDAPGCSAWPALSAVADGALAGARRLAILVEIPKDAFLIVTPSGGGTGRIAATSAIDGTRTELWSGALDGSARTISLAPLAGTLVRLDFEDTAACAARWQHAQLALASPAIPASPAGPTPAPHPPRVDNLVLVVVDTLRADRVAAIAPTRVKTPRLTAAAAARGVVFAKNQSMAPSSPPSHATIHTGQIPRVHGIAGDTGVLHPNTPILSADIAAAGIDTAFVGDNEFAMEHFHKGGRWGAYFVPALDGQGKDCAPIVERALALIDASKARGHRFFVSTLPIEPHEPYRYHPGVTDAYFAGPFPPPIGKQLGRLEDIPKWHMTSRMWDQLRGLYDGEVAHMDECFGALEDGLTARGLADTTAIVVTSDHGEGMGERGGKFGHAYSLHHELVSVPLIVLGAGLPPTRVEAPTSNLDIAATVLDLLGVAPDDRMQGASLVPLAQGGAWPVRMVASEYGKSYALRAGTWHYVVDYDGSAGVFDVAADPDETHDLGRGAPMVLRYFRDASGLYLAHRTAWREATWGTLDAIAPTSPLARD